MIYLYAVLNDMYEENIQKIQKIKGIFETNIEVLSQNSMLFLYSTIEKNIENMSIKNILEHHQCIDLCVKNEYVSTLLPFKIPTIFDDIDALKNWGNQKKEHLQKQIKLFENKVEYTLVIDFDMIMVKDSFLRKNIDIKDKKVKLFLEKKMNQPFYQIDRLITTFLKDIDKEIVSEYAILDKKCIFLVHKNYNVIFEEKLQQYLQTLEMPEAFQLSGFWAVHHFAKLYYG